MNFKVKGEEPSHPVQSPRKLGPGPEPVVTIYKKARASRLED